MNPYKDFMIESFQHEQKQILWLMSECQRARLTIHMGDLAYGLTVVVKGLRDVQADKLNEHEAFIQFHIVSRITNAVDVALTVASIERAKTLRFQAWSDRVYQWEQLGYIQLFDGAYELTEIGYSKLMVQKESA